MLKIKFFGCIFRIRNFFTLLSEFSKFLPNAFCVLETTRRLTYYAPSLKTPGIVIFNTVRYGWMHLIYALPHFIGEETVVERLNNLLEIVQVISDKTKTQNLHYFELDWMTFMKSFSYSFVSHSKCLFLSSSLFLPSIFPFIDVFLIKFSKLVNFGTNIC